MAIIGNNTIGASHTGAGDYNVQAFMHASLVYTAVTGDVVTSVSVYHADTTTGAMEVGIYTFSGGLAVTRVAVVPVTITSTLGWITTSCSIALTGGTTHTAAIDYRTDSSSWHFS